jgi:nucleoside-diphosphate-sugar epimerase
MNILVTGASGFIGNKLAITLADLGHQVHAMVRSLDSENRLRHPNIQLFKGDVLDKESLLVAMKGCEQVYHVAGKAGTWARDLSVFYNVNVEGTRNVLDAALLSGVKKTVYTSTAGVIGPTLKEPREEDDPRIVDFILDYDISKKIAEDLVAQYVKEGMDVVIVAPGKVYGPGHISHSLMLNAIIVRFLKKHIAFIPSPGTNSVSFSYIDDMVTGHILAMEKGKAGEKYILGGPNVSYCEFFNRLRLLSKRKGYIVKLSKTIVTTLARLQALNYKLSGAPIQFTVNSVDHLFSNYTFSSNKAIRELGYKITPLDEALQKTIYYLDREAQSQFRNGRK